MTSDLGFSCPSCGEPMGESKHIPFFVAPGFLNAIWRCPSEDCNLGSIMVSLRQSLGGKGVKPDGSMVEVNKEGESEVEGGI